MSRVLVLLVLGAVGLMSQTNDEVVLSPAASQNHLIVWGKFSLSPPVYQREFRNQPATVDLGGNVLPCLLIPCQANEIVAFTAGRAPGIKIHIWSFSGDSVPVTYPEEVVLKVKVWVLCRDNLCSAGPLAPDATDPAALDVTTKIMTELAVADSLFASQNAGIRLDLSAADMISNQTDNPKKNTYKDYFTNCPNKMPLLTGMIDDEAMNLYVLRTIDNNPTRATGCGLPPNIAMLGWQFNGRLIAHELGHNHWLVHSQGKPELADKGLKNIMHSDSAERVYLSEGEVYRMHFLKNSVLNHNAPGYSTPRAPRPEKRGCGTSDKFNPCPNIGARLWDDP